MIRKVIKEKPKYVHLKADISREHVTELAHWPAVFEDIAEGHRGDNRAIEWLGDGWFLRV